MIKKGLEVWDALEQFIGTIEMPIGTSDWDVETYKNQARNHIFKKDNEFANLFGRVYQYYVVVAKAHDLRLRSF